MQIIEVLQFLLFILCIAAFVMWRFVFFASSKNTRSFPTSGLTASATAFPTTLSACATRGAFVGRLLADRYRHALEDLAADCVMLEAVWILSAFASSVLSV